MTPNFTPDNFRDHSLRNLVLSSHSTLIRVASIPLVTYLYDLLSSKFVARVALTTNITILANHIARIVRRSTEEQMGRVDAGVYIATMANEHAIGDRPVGKLVSKTMRPATFSVLAAKMPVAVAKDSSGPNPTSVRLFARMCPKLLDRSVVYCARVAFAAAILAETSLHVDLQGHKKSAAVLAGALICYTVHVFAPFTSKGQSPDVRTVAGAFRA